MKKQDSYFNREWYIYIFLIIISLLIFGKLFYLQILNASELKARATTFRGVSHNLPYERGMIVDTQGNILAKSVAAKDIFADPKTVTKFLNTKPDLTKEQIADSIAAILERDSKAILDLLEKDLSWVSIQRQVNLDKANQIADLGINGIGFTSTYKRVYPTGQLTSPVLGIVNMAGAGVEGIEYYYNNELMGQNGYQIQLEDADQDQQLISTGYNLKLTLDSTIQHLVEQELDKIVENTQPIRASILAMDPMTGKILAMGSRPTFDSNNYINTNPEQRKNLNLSMIYEPGSTFKIVTGAAALEENLITPDSLFNDPGYITVNSRTITNWDSDRTIRGKITFAEGMRISSNVVLAQVGHILGKETFNTYLRSFGFGTRTKVDIAGEEQGLLIDNRMVKDLELATMSFGQANLVTPLQLLTAICAVANGGTLFQPYILDSISNKSGIIIYNNGPRAVREVISKSTSNLMTDILVGVVDKGTGSRAQIPGVKVAGKTGTSQKIDPSTGMYSATDFVATFVAYAPADNPVIALLVVIDTPKGDIIQGGTLAAPSAKKIIESTLQYYGIPVSTGTPSDLTKLSPNVPVNDITQPFIVNREPGKGEVSVPDLKGLTIRQAGEILGKLELRYRFSGSGLANQQFPDPGQIVNQGDYIEVIFSGE